MGKRELMLIVGFVIVGAVVYQATAPPAPPNEGGRSLATFFEHVKREIRGNRGKAEISTVSTHELDLRTTELRLVGRDGYQEIILTGEKRDTVEARLRVTSNGVDDANAKQLAGETHLKADTVGSSLQLEIKYPEPGQQRAFLTLLVPSRLAVRVDQGAGAQRTTIGNVASLEAIVRGETTVKNVAGRVNLTHRAGRVAIEQASAVKLTGRGSDATVSNVRGDASFSMHSGELNATLIRGAIDVECQNTEVVFKKLDDASGMVRVNAVNGSVTLEGLRQDARVDGRNTEIDIEMVKAAAIAVYNEGDEPIQITAPPGGFVLDAITKEGRLTLPDDVAKAVTATANEAERAATHANGAVLGGGPTITLRANHGDIIVRSRVTDATSSQR
jgi:hypothetical protein